MLLLDHVGAKSGTLRTTPLLYVEDGEDLLLVASKGGFPSHPAWLHNLRANPYTTVQVDAERRPVHAREAAPEDRDRLWSLADVAWPSYRDYRARAEREIPLIVLEPRTA
jgi:deazaflavin-dependent oxidoreductase (nitroreductase family)